MTDYVLGYLFNVHRSQVWLIRKERPAWQKGKLNGIGGHVEDGESPLDAMRREFKEETGVGVLFWEHTLRLFSDDWQVYVFRAFVSNSVFFSVRQTTDETPQSVPAKDIVRFSTIPNLQWMIPLQLDSGLTIPISIEDVSLPGED